MAAFEMAYRGFHVLVKRTRHFQASLITCLLAAYPCVAVSEEAPFVGAAARSGASALANAQHPLTLRFREQGRLLDDILSRLSNIEGMVDKLHVIVKSYSSCLVEGSMPPTAASASAICPPAPAPAAVAPQSLPQELTPQQPSLFPELDINDMTTQLTLAGAVLFTLAFVLWLRKRTAAAKVRSDRSGRGGGSEEALASFKEATPKPDPKRRQGVATPPEPPPAAVRPPPPPPPAPPPPAAAPQAFPEGDGTDGGGAPSAEDGDQALELAEMMLSMGLGQGAAQTLVEQISQEPKQALRHWLKLLEIYRLNGQQEEFEASAEELRKHFNVKPEDWNAEETSQQGIEDFERILKQITERWGAPDCVSYMQELLDDNRGGGRTGFPQSVAEELLMLIGILKAQGVYPD